MSKTGTVKFLNQAKGFGFIEGEEGNPGPCLACYDPGMIEDPTGISGEQVPAYVYTCDGVFDQEFIGDPTCGAWQDNNDGCGNNACIINPTYVCFSLILLYLGLILLKKHVKMNILLKISYNLFNFFDFLFQTDDFLIKLLKDPVNS